ncbi:MAG: methyltransferase domain-containing protein [Deltaproteobacteria bacterium]|nr:methyltransferase domain-containing protein [Deltaproteobacteria bacterium]
MDFSDLARLAGGYLEARAIQVAVSLGVFDALKEPSRDARAVAQAVGTDPRGTELLLNALTAIGLLEKEAQSFSLAAVASTYLVKSSPLYLGGMILFDASLWDCWGDLEKAVRTGKPVRPPDMYQGDSEATERFIYAMHSLVQARGDAEMLARALDFSGVTEFLDIGSGPGTYPISLCRKFPQLKATIFDLPATIQVTERFVREAGLGDRIRLVIGDYRRDPIPGRYQMAFLSNIIHAESEEENDRLMPKVFSCLEAGGKIVIKDHILDDSLTHPPVGVTFSLLMLLTTESGRCYSYNEVKAWLGNAGFEHVTQLPLPHPLTSSLVIGEKV